MKKMPKNYRIIGENYPEPEAKRSKTNVFHHCYDCEEQFNPTSKGQKFCAKCFKGRPSVKSTAVNHYDLQKKKMSVAPTYSKLVPEYQPSISSVVVVPNSSKLVDYPATTNSNLANQKPGYEDGLTKVKVKVVDEVKMEASNPTAKDAVRSLSGILLAEIDLSSSSDESSNNDKKEQGTRMENVTSFQIPSFTVTSDNTCPKSCLLTKQSSIPPVLSHPTPLLKSSSNSKEKSIELQDNFDLSIQNIVPDIPNQNIDFLQLELEDLRIKEEELKQMIKSHAPDNNEISTVKKRIIGLESKLYTEKEMLLRKEVEFKTYELASLEAKSVIEVLSEDKDSLCNQVKTISASLEFLRSSCKSAEKMVNEYQQKLKDAEDEGALRDYLITILRKKEERAKLAEDRIKNAVSQIEEVENDLNKINEDLQKKGAVHREMLVQLKQVKSELIELRDIHACTEKENKAAQSQMKSLKEANNQERQQKYFELKSQLVEIQKKIESIVFKQLLEIKYDAIRKELDTERESLSQLLSI